MGGMRWRGGGLLRRAAGDFGGEGAPISLSRSDTVSLAIFGKCNLNTLPRMGGGGVAQGEGRGEGCRGQGGAPKLNGMNCGIGPSLVL